MKPKKMIDVEKINFSSKENSVRINMTNSLPFRFKKINGRNKYYFVMFSCLLFLIGCGSNDGFLRVSGKITLDGTPLKDGLIVFNPAQGESGASISAEVKNGVYSTRVDSGKKIVKITAQEEIDNPDLAKTDLKKNPLIPLKITRSIIPEKYNKRTELTVEISQDKSKFDFDLKTD